MIDDLCMLDHSFSNEQVKENTRMVQEMKDKGIGVLLKNINILKMRQLVSL